eukprot:1160976-Pelagomonas_calceolata.AAC.2
MGIWRIVRHAPGRRDSPTPILHRCAPSKLPPRSPLKLKSMPGYFLSYCNISQRYQHNLACVLCCGSDVGHRCVSVRTSMKALEVGGKIPGIWKCNVCATVVSMGAAVHAQASSPHCHNGR